MMSPDPAARAVEAVAQAIREWVAAVDRAAGPKPMALPYLAAGDPVALAGTTLRTISEGVRAGSMGLGRLALAVGATADHEAAGGLRGADWGAEPQVRVGLALIDCAMRATGWFTLGMGPDGRVVLVRHGHPNMRDLIFQEVSRYDPRANHRTIGAVVAGRYVTVAVPAEDAHGGLPVGGVGPGRAGPAGRA